MRQSASELSAITRLFSSAVFRELARKGRSALFRRLIEMTDLPERCDSHATVGAAFDLAFKLLKVDGQRDEYIYRTALTQKKFLIGRHPLRTASMLSEFRAGTCKADLVILNGTSTVYEIKSERDSLVRLSNQVENYKRVFAKVNVITSESFVKGVCMTVPADVGVMCLSKRYRISVVRESIEQPDRICPSTVFESLRSDEAMAILKALGVAVPEVPNTRLRGVMHALFADLEPVALHEQMVRTLKDSRSLAPLSELVDQLPKSLHAAALSIPIRRGDHGRLVQTLQMPLDSTMAWT